MDRPLPCRLDKFLRDAIGASRADVNRLLAEGRVAIQAEGATTHPADPSTLVFPDDLVTVDGRPVTATPGTLVAALHKPLGVVSTTHDPLGHPTLAPWLEPLGPRAFAVGRLDADTSGLLLLTDDGDLAYMLLRPHHHVDKTYHLQVVGPVAEDDPRLLLLRDGVMLHGGPARARALDVIESGPHVSLIALAIDEGRRHQVRHMARVAGFDLLALERVRVGPIALGPLPVGALRVLAPAEYDALWHAVGGRDVVRQAQRDALHARVASAAATGHPHARLARWLAEAP